MVVLQIEKIEQLVMGAILTGIAVVIGKSWGDLIHSIVSRTIVYLKCQRKKGTHLKECEKEQEKNKNDPLVMTINAVLTTIILILFMIPMWKLGFSKK